jgi:hypothetical protein
LRTYEIHCLSEAVSPITHMSGSAGNESIVARERILTERGWMTIPFLSGNAMRHRAIREPGAKWLIDRYGLRGKLTLQQLNFLLHGGNLTMSTANENTRRIAEMHRCWPLLRLLGGSLPDQILTGSLHVWRGSLVCEENRQSIASSFGVFPATRLLSSESFLTGYQYTRGDAKKTGLAAERDDLPTDSNLMIFSGQSVAAGAMWYHGFVVQEASEVELGALLLSLRLWQAKGGTIGGNSRIGHGRLKLRLVNFEDDGQAVNAYVAHVDSVIDDAIAWLNDSFAKKAESKKKVKA